MKQYYQGGNQPSFVGSIITYLKLKEMRSELEARWGVNINPYCDMKTEKSDNTVQKPAFQYALSVSIGVL